MSLSKEISDMSRIILEFIRKDSYKGKIPANLDASFNMSEKAKEKCHPELDISWMQLLASLYFSVSCQDNYYIVEMVFYGQEYRITYSANCPFNITQKNDKQRAIETPSYKIICELLYNILKEIMFGLTNQQRPMDEDRPACVCLDKWRSQSPELNQQVTPYKRKHDDVD